MKFFGVHVLLFFLLLITSSNQKSRHKRSFNDNFKVLLNLYKLNPLKNSLTYQSYANNIFNPTIMRNDTFLPKPNDAPTAKKKENEIYFKNVEKIIHKRKETNEIPKHDVKYRLSSVVETFGDEIGIHGIAVEVTERNKQNYDLNELFDHINSNDIKDDNPTKLYPFNEEADNKKMDNGTITKETIPEKNALLNTVEDVLVLR